MTANNKNTRNLVERLTEISQNESISQTDRGIAVLKLMATIPDEDKFEMKRIYTVEEDRNMLNIFKSLFKAVNGEINSDASKVDNSLAVKVQLGYYGEEVALVFASYFLEDEDGELSDDSVTMVMGAQTFLSTRVTPHVSMPDKEDLIEQLISLKKFLNGEDIKIINDLLMFDTVMSMNNTFSKIALENADQIHKHFISGERLLSLYCAQGQSINFLTKEHMPMSLARKLSDKVRREVESEEAAKNEDKSIPISLDDLKKLDFLGFATTMYEALRLHNADKEFKFNPDATSFH